MYIAKTPNLARAAKYVLPQDLFDLVFEFLINLSDSNRAWSRLYMGLAVKRFGHEDTSLLDMMLTTTVNGKTYHLDTNHVTAEARLFAAYGKYSGFFWKYHPAESLADDLRSIINSRIPVGYERIVHASTVMDMDVFDTAGICNFIPIIVNLCMAVIVEKGARGIEFYKMYGYRSVQYIVVPHMINAINTGGDNLITLISSQDSLSPLIGL